MTEERKHTEISPSKLQRIILCPGSLQLARQVEQNKQSLAADRGTRLHDFAEQITTGQMTLSDIQDHDDKMAVSVALEGYKQLKERMQEGPMSSKVIEAHEEYLEIFEDLGVAGTADIIMVNDDTLAIGDYKFGNTEVFAENNTQLMAYAYGAMKKFGHKENIILCIIQPSRVSVDMWQTTCSELVTWVSEVCLPACGMALSNNPPLQPGQDQCRWCPAMGLCPEAHYFVQEKAKKVFEAYANVDALSPDALKEVLEIIPELETAIKAIKYQAKSLAGTNSLPGYKLVRKRGNRRWSNEEKVFEILDSAEVAEKLEARGMSIDDLFVHELRSPAQVEKLLGKAYTAEHMAEYIETPEGEVALVAEDDPRPNVVTDPFASYVEEN